MSKTIKPPDVTRQIITVLAERTARELIGISTSLHFVAEYTGDESLKCWKTLRH